MADPCHDRRRWRKGVPQIPAPDGGRKQSSLEYVHVPLATDRFLNGEAIGRWSRLGAEEGDRLGGRGCNDKDLCSTGRTNCKMQLLLGASTGEHA
jgi:hypothetical protein